MGCSCPIQPIQQAAAQPADDAQLRKMHVRIDQSGQQEAAAQIAHPGGGVSLENSEIIAGGLNHAVGDEQSAIREALQRAGLPPISTCAEAVILGGLAVSVLRPV